MPEIGQTVSHYRITEKLGQGGMGEVFLAHDNSLDRKVALKFLPDIFSDDLERLARFEREAKLLASLNHPNIAAIHGLEQAGGTRFLVMELVEGETLQQKIASGPLPVDEALETCRQEGRHLGIRLRSVRMSRRLQSIQRRNHDGNRRLDPEERTGLGPPPGGHSSARSGRFAAVPGQTAAPAAARHRRRAHRAPRGRHRRSCI